MAEHAYRDGCMCDACIAHRTRERVAQREIQQQSQDYIRRRGGEPHGDLPPNRYRR